MALRLALGGAMGLVLALSMLPRGVVTGEGAFWQERTSDRAAALIGYWYFVADAWRWPVYSVGTRNLPEGTSVIVTDGVPLVALGMKALHGIGVPPWKHFGAWLPGCCVLNCAAMALVLWYAEVRSSVPTIIAALLAAGMPVRQAAAHGTLTCLALAGLALALGYVSSGGPPLADGLRLPEVERFRQSNSIARRSIGSALACTGSTRAGRL